jgi:hypothetical protein
MKFFSQTHNPRKVSCDGCFAQWTEEVWHDDFESGIDEFIC